MSHTICIGIYGGIWLSDSIFKPTSYMVDDFPKNIGSYKLLITVTYLWVCLSGKTLCSALTIKNPSEDELCVKLNCLLEVGILKY